MVGNSCSDGDRVPSSHKKTARRRLLALGATRSPGWREHPHLVAPGIGPGAAHHLLQHSVGRTRQPFHDLRSQERQPHNPAHLRHVHAFGLGNLVHQRRPLLVQQALPVVRQSECPHQRGVLRGRLLEAWRDARRTAGQATVKAVTTSIIAALLVGTAIKLKLMDGCSVTAPPKLCLLDDWRPVARRAWSIRLSIVAALFTAAEVVPLFSDVLPRGVFVLLAFSASIGAAIARLVAQPEMHR